MDPAIAEIVAQRDPEPEREPGDEVLKRRNSSQQRGVRPRRLGVMLDLQGASADTLKGTANAQVAAG